MTTTHATGTGPIADPSAQRRSTITDLRGVVLGTQLSFSLVLTTLLLAPPVLLLLRSDRLSDSTQWYLFVVSTIAAAVVLIASWLDLRRLDFLLKALLEDTDIVAPADVYALGKQARRCCVNWLWPHMLSLVLFVTPLRPSLMDLTTGIAITLLCMAITATVALALYATLRRSFLRVIELVPPKVMTEVVLSREGTTEIRERISRRLVIAVVMPMLFVALGCALIANAHVRRADERQREEIARAMARSVFRPSASAPVSLSQVYAKATEMGFSTRVIEQPQEKEKRLLEGGVVEVTTALSEDPKDGSALVRFHGSTVDVLGTESLLFTFLAVIAAAALGLTLGNALTQDLFQATEGIRLLGTRALLSKSTEGSTPARFRIVDELQQAIEGVAERFRIFAQAQQDAISARAAATRMRGQFFASVSHDLKGPLNSILGFTELVRMEPLTEGQQESLQVVADRGQELLTLINTILDAARIEVGQLSLMFDEETFTSLYAETLEKAKQLSGEAPLSIAEELEEDLPNLVVDRVRTARALATFIAYSARASEGAKTWIRAERQGQTHVRIDIDVPARMHTSGDLQQMLDPAGGLSKREHRGLALALQLANSVIRLHGGTVQVLDRRNRAAMFSICLPTAKASGRPRQPSLALGSAPSLGSAQPAAPAINPTADTEPPPPASGVAASSPASAWDGVEEAPDTDRGAVSEARPPEAESTLAQEPPSSVPLSSSSLVPKPPRP